MGLKTSIHKRIADGDALTPKLIAEEAEAGDPLSNEIIMDTARWLGIGLVTLIHTIDPSGVLLGGAMTFGGGASELGRRFLGRIKQEIDARAFALLAERIQVEFASPGPTPAISERRALPGWNTSKQGRRNDHFGLSRVRRTLAALAVLLAMSGGCCLSRRPGQPG